LYKEGDPAEEVYFIFKGQIKLMTKEKIAFRVYKEGSMFGESDILYKEGRDR
jgi:CRP-like cAMP-binding protein